MDKNPNLPRRQDRKAISKEEATRYPERAAYHTRLYAYHGGSSSGISRKEFIRLTYGEFKAAGKEDYLVKALEAKVVEGMNAARRLLARIHLHQGKPAKAKLRPPGGNAPAVGLENRPGQDEKSSPDNLCSFDSYNGVCSVYR